MHQAEAQQQQVKQQLEQRQQQQQQSTPSSVTFDSGPPSSSSSSPRSMRPNQKKQERSPDPPQAQSPQQEQQQQQQSSQKQSEQKHDNPNAMKVVLVGAECAPWSKTGMHECLKGLFCQCCAVEGVPLVTPAHHKRLLRSQETYTVNCVLCCIAPQKLVCHYASSSTF